MSDAVQQIKDKLNIIDIISPYVELHKAGKNFKGKSPFSSEKTPSFYVSPDRGMYYCFSTSQGGDIFNFVQAMEGVDFKGALKILADKAGVELVPEDPKKKTEREHLYSELEEATVFFSEFLTKDKDAQEYLEKRGVKTETVKKWRIGYAPGPPKYGWREAKDYLEEKGFKKEELFKAGLIKEAGANKEPFDVFRDRVMFPMAEPSGKVVAFSGRLLHPNDKAPKYVNSPETELYKKSELLFGYDKAKTGIRTLDFSLVVEGQFDVVMCHQAGYANTVAVSGTALTLHHVQLLERLSEKVVLALDADRAGIAAMKKAAELMLGRGLDVKIAEMPEGQDPADIIKDKVSEFRKIIGKSVHVIEFLLHVLRKENTDDRAFKLKVREEVLPFILLLPNRIDQEHFVDKVVEAINSTKDAVHYELERQREKLERSVATQDTYGGVIYNEEVKEKEVDNGFKPYLYLKAATAVLDEELSSQLKKEVDKILEISDLSEPSESDMAGTIFILEQQFANMPSLAKTEEVVAKLNLFKTTVIRKRLAEHKAELLAAEEAGADEVFSDVLKSITQYEKMLREPIYEVDRFRVNKG